MSADLLCRTRKIPTLVINVPALVRSEPWFEFNKHRKMAGMERFAQRVLGKSVTNNRIQSNDTQLLTTNVFVCMVKRGLSLLSIHVINSVTTREVKTTPTIPRRSVCREPYVRQWQRPSNSQRGYFLHAHTTTESTPSSTPHYPEYTWPL